MATTTEGATPQQPGGDVDELSKWLTHFGLSIIGEALRGAGLEEYGLINTLEDEDVEEMINEAQLKKLRAKAFRKAVKAVKDGSYAPAPAKQDEAKTEEKTQDPFLSLRESRTSLKGIVRVKANQPTANVNDGKQTRTVIFIGQTGAGKTTLINSMCNYLHCVTYEEAFRYKLIMEEKNTKIAKDTTKSQTVDITKYQLRDLPAIGFALNIIDTPGFGDTEGPEQDRKIRGKFKQFFEKEDRIDAIYFVVKHSDTRLGAIQKYIFGMVLDLFGKDVKDNIFILFTFSDGAEPPALKAVKKLEVPYKAYYQINNSGFGLLEPGKTNRTHQMFFDLGMEQFRVIFDELAHVKPVSTNMTRQTLKLRDTITSRLFQIGQYLKTALDEIDAMHKTQEFIKANKDKMDANEEFKFEEWETKVHRDPLTHNGYTTYCKICIYTCHSHCGLPDARKYDCCMMENGYCTACKDKCEWRDHVNMPYTIRRERIKVWKTKAEMAERYNIAKGETARYEDFMRASIKRIDDTEKMIIDIIKNMKEAVNTLRTIALNKNILTDDQYFDTLIQNEKDERGKGWEKRVENLESMKTQNKLLRDVNEKDEEQFLKENKIRSDKDLAQYRQAYAAEHAIANTAQQAPQQVDVTDEYKILGKVVYSKTTTTTTTTIQQK